MNFTELLITGCTVGAAAIPCGAQMHQAMTANVYCIPETQFADSLVMAWVDGEFRLVTQRELEDMDDLAAAKEAKAAGGRGFYSDLQRELGLR